MTLIGGGIQGEAVRYAGQDLKALGVYTELADGIYSGPPVRGANILIPYSDGQRWTQKYFDERHVVLNGMMLSTGTRLDFQGKLDALKSLFRVAAGEQRLEVQWQDGSFRYIMAEVRNTLGLQYQLFPTRSSVFSIELVASDPFWYAEAVEGINWTFDSGVMSFDDGTHWFDQGLVQLVASTQSVDAQNDGTIYNRKPVFYLSGAMSNPKVYNQRNGYWLQVTTTTVAGDLVVIDCGAQTATKNGVALAASLVALGPAQLDWMHIETGANTLTLNTGANFLSPVNYQAFFSAAYL